MTRFAPGDPAAAIVGNDASAANLDACAAISAERRLPVQFGQWAALAGTGSFPRGHGSAFELLTLPSPEELLTGTRRPRFCARAQIALPLPTMAAAGSPGANRVHHEYDERDHNSTGTMATIRPQERRALVPLVFGDSPDTPTGDVTMPSRFASLRIAVSCLYFTERAAPPRHTPAPGCWRQRLAFGFRSPHAKNSSLQTSPARSSVVQPNHPFSPLPG